MAERRWLREPPGRAALWLRGLGVAALFLGAAVAGGLFVYLSVQVVSRSFQPGPLLEQPGAGRPPARNR